MKNKLFLFFVVLMFLTSSCSVTRQSHTQVMEQAVLNQTKYGILSKFGRPTLERKVGVYEEWIYDIGKRAITLGESSSTMRNVNEKSPSYFASSNPNAAGSGSLSNTYKSYIKITFLNGRVTKWETQGVDYGVKGQKVNLSAVLIVYVLVLAVTLSVLATSTGPSYYY